MRDYVTGIYGQFDEVSVNLGLHLRLKIWRPTIEEFQSVVDELRSDVAAAGGDWTGTLVIGPETMRFKFGEGFMQDILKIYYHGTSQASGAFDTAWNAQLTDEPLRKDGYNSSSEE